MKLVVLDANAYWTEQLFCHCPVFEEVLLLKPREARAHRAQYGRWFGDGAPREIGDGVWEQTFSMLPGWFDRGWPVARRWIARSVRDFAGDNPYALVVSFPQYRTILDDLDPELSIYYNYDDYRDNWPTREEQLPAWEDELVRRADLTLCIAKYRVDVLARRVPERAERIYHVPIGCTAEFIAESTSPPKPTPPKHLAEHLTGSKPTAGYIGTLGARFHHDLLADVATIRADTTFILGGKVPTPSDDFGWANGYHRLREMDHVHFIGWVPHEELDRYLMSFDVLLMPYAPCRFNRNACPAKLWDYMGTTRPIIANDVVPEVNMWSDVVHIADSPKSFASSIRGAVDEPSDIPSRRLEIARNHTYEALGERAGTIIKRHLHIPESE